MTIFELMEVFYAECRKTRSIETIRHYKRRMLQFNAFLKNLKIATLSELQPDILERLNVHLRTKGIADNTRYVYLETPKRFMQFLYDNNYTLINYAGQFQLPKWRRDQRLSAYKHADFPELLKSVHEKEPQKSRDQAILALFVLEKLKTPDIEKLTLMDLELDENELRLAQKKRFHRLKEETVTYLKKYVVKRHLANPKTDYLFTNKGGGKFHAESVRAVLKKAVRHIHNGEHYYG